MDPEYEKHVFAPSEQPESLKDKGVKAKKRAALKEAHEIRRFEIDLYWRRSLYFWGFQAVFFTACALIFAESKPEELEIVPLIAIALLGLIVSILWFFLEKGSKAWQENWENHIDQLENEFTGRLHKIVLGDAKNFYSVTKINQLFIIIIGFSWICFFVYLLSSYDFLYFFAEFFLAILIVALTAIVKIIKLYVKSGAPRNRHIKDGEIGIGVKVYDRWRDKE